MANKILTTVLDIYGNSYPTDVYVEHDAHINSQVLEGKKIPVMLTFYKSQADKAAGYRSFIPIRDADNKIPITSFVQTLEDVEIPTFNAVAMQAKVLTYLKEIYGEANVVDV